MGYAILRTKKLKTIAAVVGSAKHTFRQIPTPNADPAATGRNRTVGAKSAEAVTAAVSRLLPEKRRKDAVLCIEYLITASPEDFKRHGGRLDDLGGLKKGDPGYFTRALDWLKARHGAENVVSSTIHLDETTPHLVAYVVPKTKDGRLSARDYLGGSAKLREMQDSFHRACGEPLGLDRGVKGGKAKHEDVQQFYGALRDAGEAPQLTRKDYAAAAVGIETESWKKAQEATQATAKQAAVSSRKRKAIQATTKAQEQAEDQMGQRSMQLKLQEQKQGDKARALDGRERALDERERNLRSRENELDAEKARADALERQLQMLQERDKPKQDQPARKRNRGSDLEM